MVRVVITGLGIAIVGGTISRLLGLGPAANEGMMVGSIIVGTPIALGVKPSDIRERLRQAS